MSMAAYTFYMIRTVTQEVGLEERLKPDVGETHSPQSMHQCGQQKFGKSMHSKLACGLLRSPSLERLRQFPSYLCTRGSYDFKVWLENSRTALSDSISRSLLVAHELIFTLFVYSIILTIVAQVCLVMNTLVFYKVPRGPTFLYVTTAILGGIMFIAVPFTSTKPRPHPNSLAGQEVTAQPTPAVSEKTE
ncbi:uncharacterized protein LOC103506942 isoform X3 [Diaphorina citri]|uniref:Uncharacterized protein LOC103506942 isoform X1 n=2 Tax=Diaphorina citri TaxID=121845 RepID=A0A3Q0ISW4_DIACI|nr:uncharacterized protein LOC103506942 isoform X1 [Diaphorina citri]XP_026677724.1 uncharacterized protein LOC103506942 isoform X2 [Diaphorina citri]XP_026677725.1 uncharacterized protein LOC103506942 isoform X3 [Diaphorina citri]